MEKKWIPPIWRQNTKMFHLLPNHNPYIGYLNHNPYLENKEKQIKKDSSTQTDMDPALIIGDKVIAGYGTDYKILLNKNTENM